MLDEQDGPIVTLTLNKSETRKALTDADIGDALVEACGRIGADLSVRAVILTGNGPAFSSGGNLKHMRDRVGTFGGSAAEIRDGYRRGIQRVTLAVYNPEVPTIAAVNGRPTGRGAT